jgi:methylase of polypeptide subunit release factors
MSKHALSRIYEHYVSLLSFDEADRQLYFFQPFPSEKQNKSYGSVYTPQFIARFFARFLRDQYPPRIFRNMKILDPACGSGIFLRTILEMQCSPSYDGLTSDEIDHIFSNVKGIDVDENATHATILSLSLLYLILMGGKLPTKLDIISENALEFIQNNSDMLNCFDVVVANPPFVAFDSLKKEMRETIHKTLGEFSIKKPDTYLAFLKLGIDLLNFDGYGLYVLPHSFLRTFSAEKLRKYLCEKTNITCLVDLSAIPVFKEKGSYVILIIFQKKPDNPQALSKKPPATLIVCQDFVGHALQDYLYGKRIENNFYCIYDVDQELFANTDWTKILLPPSNLSLVQKLANFKPLRDFLSIKQGIITGTDDLFIVHKSKVPQMDSKIWIPLLRDRDMQRYIIPKTSAYYVFYPIIEGKVLDEKELKEAYPETWDYLLSQKYKISIRTVKTMNWWLPARLRFRDENRLGSPKILTPHLVLIPRFSMDIDGKYLVSHSPYLSQMIANAAPEFLKFFLAILNSTVGAWLISTHSDKYSKGYSRLEVKTLNSIPVPDPAKVKPTILLKLLHLVDQKLAGKVATEIDSEIDELVAEIYDLNTSEKLVVGFEGYHA